MARHSKLGIPGISQRDRLASRRMNVATPHTRHAAASLAEAATWHVRVLGGFELDDGQHRLTRLRSRAAMVLLTRLAMAPLRNHSREELVALLWPEADAVAGRNRLRQTLSLLKSVLEPAGGAAVLQADRRVLRVVPGALWCDAVAFEAAQRAGQRELAQALYLGELLPGFYDEWVADERLRLQSLAERSWEGPGVPAPGAAHAASAASTASTAAFAAGLAAPLRASAAAPPAPGTRLPQYLTRLIGADQQGARLRALVSEQRLVVVLGAGGSGKTRLAIEVARLLCTAAEAGTAVATSVATSAVSSATPAGVKLAFFERALFVSLVGAATRTELLDRLALALRVASTGDTVEALLEVLDGRPLLVLLDNAEQLDEAAAAAIAHLAERLPAVHWLVSSRRPLALDGEHDFHLQALDLPAADATLPEVVMNPAVALFVDRARAHRPDFHVPAAHRQAIVDLVRWLEGLPLAIELAASHTRVMGPAELLALLQAARAERDGGSLAFLARRGARSGSDLRHASMQAVVAWSWQLLAPAPQRLLLALCLLPAGATLAAAARLAREPAVTGIAAAAGMAGRAADAGDAGDAGEAGETGEGLAGRKPALAATQSLLDELLTHSVVRAGSGQDGQWRYVPMEPVREFVLALNTPSLQTWRRRVLDSLLAWAQAMPATPPLPSVRDELPNIMQALADAPADGHANDALHLVLLLQSSWGEISLPAGLMESLDRLLQAPGLDDSRAAGAHAMAAWSCQEAGRPEDVRRHMAAALARPCPDPALQSMVLSRVARMHWRVDKDAVRARALIARGLPLARAAQRPNTEAALLSLEGHLATVVDKQAERGKALSAQALALWAESGNRHLVNAGRYNVAVQTLEAGHAAAALPEFDALAAEGRELQDWDLASGALEARGSALLKLRRWAESAASLRESLAVAWDGLEMQATVYALWNVAPALARLRLGLLAAETMGAAEAQWQQRFGAMDPRDRRDLRRMRRFARVLLGVAATAQAWQLGRSRTLGQAVQVVLSGLPVANDAANMA